MKGNMSATYVPCPICPLAWQRDRSSKIKTPNLKFLDELQKDHIQNTAGKEIISGAIPIQAALHAVFGLGVPLQKMLPRSAAADFELPAARRSDYGFQASMLRCRAAHGAIADASATMTAPSQQSMGLHSRNHTRAGDPDRTRHDRTRSKAFFFSL